MNKIITILIILLLTSCKKYDYTWMSIGDSITAADGEEFKSGPHTGEKIIGYQTVFTSKSHNSIDINNEGYSGHSLAGHTRSVYQKIKEKDFSDQDIVTIFVGTNDFKLNKPIISRDSIESFRYCYTSLVKKIKGQNPNVNLYLITPLKRDKDGYSTTSKNKVGLKLIDYRNEIVRIGNENDIEVIDLYNESGIDESNLKIYTIDGLHLSNAGHEVIGGVLNNKIRMPAKMQITSTN